MKCKLAENGFKYQSDLVFLSYDLVAEITEYSAILFILGDFLFDDRNKRAI